MSEVLLTIWCQTYNHEKYIKNAIDSFLSQKVNFRYEILVHDDASTDRTQEVLREYEEKYPELIYVIYQKENQAVKSKGWEQKKSILQNKMRGKYFALCEGDDCWLSSYKLQLQVDYLEEHLDCIMVSHDAVQLDYTNGYMEALEPYKEDKDLTPEELIIQPYGRLPTASLVCRKEALQMGDFFTTLGIGDYPLHLYCLEKGKVHYFNQVMSVYRFMHRGSWSARHYGDDRQKTFINLMELLDFILDYNVYTKRKYERYVISKAHSYVFHLLYSVFKFETAEKRLNNYIDVCREYDEKTGYIYHKFCGEIERIFLQTTQKKYYNPEIEKFAFSKKYIVIFGAGVYATILAKQMEYNHINFDGFVVSDNQNIEKYKQEKDIYKLRDLPYDKREVGVIVGVNPYIWHEVIQTLEIAEITSYICPFLLNDERIL